MKHPLLYPDLTAYILAGGKSRRMGTDKALLLFEGRSLLDRSVALAGAVAREVRIVASADATFSKYGPVVRDVFPDCGPLGGIHAALSQSSTDLNLVLAVDMPFVSARLLSYLVDVARVENALATVPQTADGWQPLCAIYRRGFAPIAEAALRAGRNKIDRLFADATVHIVSSQQLESAGFSAAEFRNLNTPEQAKAAARDYHPNE